MFEKLVSLLERAVIALEAIAANANLNTGRPVTGDMLKYEGAVTGRYVSDASVKTNLSTGLDYDAIAAGPGGDAVIRQMCADRGIEVPPRTRTTTLIQKLKVRDAVDEAKLEEKLATIDNSLEATMTASNAEVTDTAITEEFDPGLTEDPAPDSDIPEDPFQTLDPFQAAAVYTAEEFRATVRHWYSDKIGVAQNHPEYRKKCGEATALLNGLINKYGQSNLQSIPEDVIQKIMAGEAELVKIYETRVKGSVA